MYAFADAAVASVSVPLRVRAVQLAVAVLLSGSSRQAMKQQSSSVQSLPSAGQSPAQAEQQSPQRPTFRNFTMVKLGRRPPPPGTDAKGRGWALCLQLGRLRNAKLVSPFCVPASEDRDDCSCHGVEAHVTPCTEMIRFIILFCTRRMPAICGLCSMFAPLCRASGHLCCPVGGS